MKRILTLCGMLCCLTLSTLLAQHPRYVLIEDFSSVTCEPCGQAAANVTKVAKESAGNVVTIQYHLDIPGRNDPFYAQNKAHQDARATYYGGFNSLPQVYVGGFSVNGQSELGIKDEVQFQRSEEAPIKVSVSQSLEGNTIQVTGSITGADGLPNGYRLYAAAVEKHVVRTREYFSDTVKSQPYYNETEFHDLFRTFASPSNGVEVVLKPGGTQNFNYTVTVPTASRWNAGEIYVIAWVQDEFNNEVVQVGFSKPTNSVKSETEIAGYALLNVSPNPADADISLDLQLGAPENLVVEIYDVAGVQVERMEQGKREAGIHRVDLPTGDLPSGSYLVRVIAGPFVASRTVQVVR